MKNEQKDKMLVYIPNGAKINIDNIPMSTPSVQYENRKKIIDRDIVKKKYYPQSKEV